MKRIQHKKLKEIDDRMLPLMFHLQSLLVERAAIDQPATVEFIATLANIFTGAITKVPPPRKEEEQ